MASTRKRKRAMSQVNGKRGDDGKDTTKAEPPVNPTTPDSRPTKKSRSQHPQRTQLPAFPAPLLLHHPVLSLYFPKLLLLHSFLQQALSFSKPSSLRKLEEIGKGTDTDLALLLKTAIVGLKELRAPNTVLDIQDATQSTGGSRQATSSQSEIVDLTLHTLFYRSLSTYRPNSAVYPGKPNNILAQGYSLNNNRFSAPGFNAGPLGIDIVNYYPNAHVGTLKSPIWGRLLSAVGDEVMLDLLLNTSIFLQLDSNQSDIAKSNYYQLAGPSLSDSLNNLASAPAPPAPTKASVVAAPGTRSAGAPLKRSLSEIEGTGAKLIEKKIRPNRPSAVHFTNRNNDSKNDKKIPDDLLHSNKKNLSKSNPTVTRDLRTPGEITFVRSRMFYSKPAYNGCGEVEFGLRHIHVLNRFPDASVKSHTVHILKYIFPRQFNLHNAFTSIIDRKETVQPLKDYTLREKEIIALNNKKPRSADDIPKRLRGTIFELVARMQRLHKRCSYHALVKYYCPVVLCDGVRDKRIFKNKPSTASSGLATQDRDNFPLSKTINTTDAACNPSDSIVKQGEAFTDFASTPGEVSAFARAVIGSVIPRDFWGKGGGGEANRKMVMDSVDWFIKMRRYESLSLHEVMQGLKLTDFDWLCPPGMTSTSKLSSTDALKRRQLLAEFLFWLFDSFLIPLLRFHFYITESGAQRNRIFYFRHDEWRKICEPTLNILKRNMFQEMKPERVKKILDQRNLGFAQIRLLPKKNGVRPVMNLKRRTLKVDKRRGMGKVVLAPSINSILTPIHNVLAFERSRNLGKMGASISSVRDLYPRLKAFQTLLKEKGWTGRKLYFAKVDIQSCFDTIPQGKLIKLIETIVTEEEYRIEKHAEIKPPLTIAGAKRPIRRYLAKASLTDEFERFEDFAKSEVKRVGARRTIFVDDVVHLFKDTNELLDLLEEHVRRNIIKIGKKFFRQKNGIPQGSVLSSILCNFFYGDLENSKLSFALAEDGVLLRLVDDFLYITLERGKAEKFLKIMHEGHPEYGAFVGAHKSMANFETSVGGVKINSLVDTSEFPYCGNLINTKSLDIRKDRGGKSYTNINDILTVEYSKRAGQALHRKAVGSFKMQVHPMYFDTEFNSFSTVLKNIYHNFIEAAMKFHRSVRALTGSKQPRASLLIKIVSEILELSYTLLRKNSGGKYRCTVKRSQVQWLGVQAFKKTLGRKQTKYRELLEWLDNTLEKEEAGGMVVRISCLGTDPFQSFKY